MTTLRVLNDSELDAVTGGHPLLISGGLVNVGPIALDVDVTNNTVEVLRNGEVVKNVGIGVAVAAGVLGAAGAAAGGLGQAFG